MDNFPEIMYDKKKAWEETTMKKYVAMCLLLCLLLTGCGHKHTEASWICSPLEHWYECEDCGEKVAQDHKTDAEGFCTVCGGTIYDNGDGTYNIMTYDAWGATLAKTGSMAGTLGVHNPFRYRGYVFDLDTGLYYLKSRYYNPKWGRFINADVLLGKRGVLLGHNLFTYCNNAPSVRNDPSGRRSIWVGIKEFVGNFLQLSGQQAVLSYEQNLQAFRSVTSGASGILLEWKGYPVAQDMFNHFLFGEGADYENTAMLEDNLSHNTEMIDAIKLQCPTDGYEITNGDVVFKDGDMHFAIGKAHFTAKVYQKNERWHADVVLTDKYNFDEWRLVKNGISLSNAANDFGTFLEGIKIGEAYSVVVSFTCIW